MSSDSKFSSFDNVLPSHNPVSRVPPVPEPLPSAPIILFGSQGSDFLAGFDVILAISRHHPELAAFLSLALDAIRVELQSVANPHGDGLSSAVPSTKPQTESEVELLPLLPPWEPFSDLKTLVRFHRQSGLKDPVINGVLLCLLQTASVVAVFCAAHNHKHAEHEQTALACLKQAWIAISQPRSHLLGFCTGALSAFAARQLEDESATAAFPNIWAYAQDAVKAIRICFWVSLRSAHARLRLIGAEGRDAASGHWSIAIAVKHPDLLEKVYLHLFTYNKIEHGRPLDKPTQLVVAARAVNQISIGGPPRQLERFKAHLLEHLGSNCRISPLEIFSPYHTPELGAEEALVMLDLERRRLADDALLPPSRKILWETVNPGILAETRLRAALRTLVRSNLCSTADWDAMINQLVLLEGESPDTSPLERGTIVSFGPGTNLAADLKRRLAGQPNTTLSSETATMIDVPSLLRDWMSDAARMRPRTPLLSLPEVHGEEVVIVSMACRFPGDVRSPEQLWTCLETGRSTVSEIPKHLFDIEAYYGSGVNQTMARHMHALPEHVVKSMDARLFSMSPKEIEQLDPQHRLTMLCSYEALERAGYSPEANSPSSFDGKRIAVCMGASWDDYRENASWNIGSYFITGNIRAFIPGHVSFSLKWEGPSVSVDSLECTAVSAIQWSRRALLSGQCDVALAGAVSVLTQPQIFIAMDKERILSRTGTNATFTSKLDGKTRGDGCGVLLLKRRSTALQDGDKILATLPAARTTFHGRAHDSETLSTRQSEFLARVMSEAGIRSSDLVHIEASGFHTQQGEADEFDSFARLMAHSRTPAGGVSVASLRPNLGGGEAVSAMSSVMKAVLMLEKGCIPRQVSVSDPSELQPRIAATCANSALFVPMQAQLLPTARDRSGRRTILVNSVASTGCHGAVLVGAPTIDEDALPKRYPAIDARCAWVFVLSSKTKESGEILKKSLIDYLQREVCLADLSYTLACRRSHHPFRLSVVASGQDELIRLLRSANFIEAKSQTDLPRAGLFFESPNPSSIQNMGAFFAFTSGLRDRLDELTLAMRPFGGQDEACLRFDLMQICLASLLEDCGIRPAIVRGNNAAMLISGRKIDKQSVLRKLCGFGINIDETHFMHANPTEAAANTTPEVFVTPTSTGLPLSDEPGNPTRHVRNESLEIQDESTLPSGYLWIKIGDSVNLVSDELVSEVTAVRGISDAQRLQRWLLSSLGNLHQQGYSIRWIEYFRSDLHRFGLINELPTYPFHLQQFWMEYRDRNLLQHPSSDEESSSAEHTNTGVSFDDATQEPDAMETIDLLTQPLLTAQTGSHTRTRTYTSDLTGDVQVALMQVSMPCAFAIELLSEAAQEVYDSFNRCAQMDDVDCLCLSHLQLHDSATSLLHVPNVELVVVPDESVEDRRKGHIKLEGGAGCPRIGESRYHWLRAKTLDRHWSKLHNLLQEKIFDIKNNDELLSAKLIYKSIRFDLANSARFIQSAHVNTRAREMVFCNTISCHELSTMIDEQCVLALLVSTLQECAVSFISHFNSCCDGQYGIIGIDEFTMHSLWVEKLKQPSDSKYMAFVTISQRADLNGLSATEIEVDMLLLDEDSRIVAELDRVRLARVECSSAKRGLKIDTSPPPPLASGPKHVPSSKAEHGEVDPNSQPNSLEAAGRIQPRTKQTGRAAELHSQILEVLASELGIAVEEMKPSVKFADLGLDSLMSLVCISSLETLKLGLEIPQSIFMEYDSPEELLTWVREQVGGSNDDNDDTDAHLDQVCVGGTSQGVTVAESTPVVATVSVSSRADASQVDLGAQPMQSSAAVDVAFSTIMSTIETELGVSRGSIDDIANLADLGMDSLMSLLVLGNLSGKLPIELPSSLFMDCTSLRDIRTFLSTELDISANNTHRLTNTVIQQTKEASQLATRTNTIPRAKPPVLVQTSTDATNLPPLFLLPDGSGMSTVYQFIHAIDRPIYSINSPFLANATLWNGGMAQITQYYLACMKLIQPTGPWIVGGWSFGGMVAFEIARLLSTASGEENDRIAALFLLDTPCPVVYPPLPMGIVDWILTAPEVRNIAPPALSAKLIAHFKATVDNLARWEPTPIGNGGGAGKVPRVWYLVAELALPGRMEEIRGVNETVRWLFRSNRAEECGADGWDVYVAKEMIQVVSVVGANHFTMVREPAVAQVASILQEACHAGLRC